MKGMNGTKEKELTINSCVQFRLSVPGRSVVHVNIKELLFRKLALVKDVFRPFTELKIATGLFMEDIYIT